MARTLPTSKASNTPNAHLRLRRRGWWVHLKYYLLFAILIAAACGVLISGFLAAIPVVTRGMMFIFGPL